MIGKAGGEADEMLQMCGQAEEVLFRRHEESLVKLLSKVLTGNYFFRCRYGFWYFKDYVQSVFCFYFSFKFISLALS